MRQPDPPDHEGPQDRARQPVPADRQARAVLRVQSFPGPHVIRRAQALLRGLQRREDQSGLLRRERQECLPGREDRAFLHGPEDP